MLYKRPLFNNKTLKIHHTYIISSFSTCSIIILSLFNHWSIWPHDHRGFSCSERSCDAMRVSQHYVTSDGTCILTSATRRHRLSTSLSALNSLNNHSLIFTTWLQDSHRSAHVARAMHSNPYWKPPHTAQTYRNSQTCPQTDANCISAHGTIKNRLFLIWVKHQQIQL